MTEYESLLIEALEYSKYGFKVFALNPLSKIPFEGSNGFKDATTDQDAIYDLFMNKPNANIGITITDTDYFVVDCDRHKEGQDGLKSLMQLSNGQSLPDNAVTVQTPSGGFHFLFKKPSNVEVKHEIDFKDGLDILKYWFMAPGSRIRKEDGSVSAYKLISGSLSDVPEAPQWLLDAILSKQQAKQNNTPYMLNLSRNSHNKKYTATILQKIVKGIDEPGRNTWLTSITGTFLRLGMDPANAYELLLFINESFVRPALPEKEVNTIFKSVLKAESNKKEVVR